VKETEAFRINCKVNLAEANRMLREMGHCLFSGMAYAAHCDASFQDKCAEAKEAMEFLQFLIQDAFEFYAEPIEEKK